MSEKVSGNWDVDDPSTWCYRTAVDAHAGYHHTGAVMREYRDIEHCAGDLHTGEFDADAWADTSAEDRRDQAEWWSDVLGALHDAAVAMAEASPERLGRAMVELGLDPTDREASPWDVREADDLEQQAEAGRLIIAALA